MSKPGLELRQGQSLVMTQQLRQSISLLQLSTPELNNVIEAELEKNPLLTREEERQDTEVPASTTKDDPHPDAEPPGEPLPQQQEIATESVDMDAGDVWGESDTRYTLDRDGAQSMRHGTSDLSDLIEQRVASGTTLHEALMAQMRLRTHSALEEKIAEAMVDMVDSAGYLPPDAQERAAQLGIDSPDYVRTIGYLQECEPTGVGARSLQECLSLQLAEQGLLSTSMQQLLEHLELVAKGDLKRLCKLCGITREALAEFMANIRRCDPKPGSRYDTHTPQTLIPEVLVRKHPDGQWVIELNPETLPGVLLDQDYTRRLKQGIRDKNDAKAVNTHLTNANWLLRAIDQRNTTLLNVATEIVKQQEHFFEFGIQYLKPMTLKDIATEVDCHESTVSRITTSKYLHCTRGTFELKYFFTSTLGNANGGTAYSSRTVMHLIQQMTDEESPDAILSDDAMTKQLNRKGIDVARRTVVKYRKQMGIPSSVERRRIKRVHP